MKVFVLVALVFAAVVCGVLASSEEQQSTDVVYEPNTHVRTKRSPYDPLIPSLLLGKSFLLGAVLGPRLLHRRRYVHYAPRHVVYNGGWGWRR
jgi:hypothetical protein